MTKENIDSAKPVYLDHEKRPHRPARNIRFSDWGEFCEGHFAPSALVDCVNHGTPHAPEGPTDATYINCTRDFGTFGYGNG